METPCVLVVDDDEDIRVLVQTALEDAGHQVVSAPNGAGALQLLESGLEPGAVLLDLMMPGINGLEAMQTMQAQERFADIPVALLTAYPAMARDARDADGIEIFTKPVDIDELVRFADRHCTDGRGAAQHPV